MKLKKSLLLFLIISAISLKEGGTVAAQVYLKAVESSRSIAERTERIIVEFGNSNPILSFYNARIERIAPNGTTSTVYLAPQNSPFLGDYLFVDQNVNASVPYYDYVLYASGIRLDDTRVNTRLARPGLNCVKLNQVYRKTCHNCYEKQYSLTFKTALDITKVVEIDIYSDDLLDRELNSGVWQVRHSGLSPNNNNCGSGDKNFDICLDDAIQYHNAFPNHDPIIIYLDLKSSIANELPGNGENFWKKNHRPSHLDEVLENVGVDNIYKPSDLKGNFNNLRFAAKNQNWPALGDVKGKFIFVLTGANKFLNEYLNEQQDNGLAFVAPSGDETPNYNDFIHPPDMSSNNWKHIVFYNLNRGKMGVIKEYGTENGAISRVWEVTLNPFDDDDTTPSEYGERIYRKINNIAIFNIFDDFAPDNIIVDDKILETETDNVLLGVPFTQWIDSKYDEINVHGSQTVTTLNLRVQPETHYDISAGRAINILPGTEIKQGADTEIFIADCPTAIPQGIPEKTQLFTNEKQKETKKYALEQFGPPSISPNPASRILNIFYTTNLKDEVLFSLYDINGRIVKHKTHKINEVGKQNFTVNVSDLSVGMYFYKMHIGNELYTGKVIKK